MTGERASALAAPSTVLRERGSIVRMAGVAQSIVASGRNGGWRE